MKFQISREALLKPLTLVAGVVERRQTLPILANARLDLDEEGLSLTGTDLEVEMTGRVSLEAAAEAGQLTAPARKLLDICKALPEGSTLTFTLKDENRLQITSGRSRFSLTTLPASDFPGVEESQEDFQLEVSQGELRHLIERTAFAMAQQDVRYYLNGMLWEVSKGQLRVVATDGHRLAMSIYKSDAIKSDSRRQLIVPRKGVLELQRLLANDESPVTLVFGKNHVRAITSEFTFTSKLVDGKFPDYERVLPKGGTKQVDAPREDLRQALARVAILSNEKYRGVRVILSENQMQVMANNPEQEEAEETVAVSYKGAGLEIGFNVSYLLDVTGVLTGEQVRLTLSDSNSSALVESASGDGSSVYVVMPMRL